MEPNSILKDFDLGSIKTFKANLGEFDTMSLTAHYNNRYSEYQTGATEFMLTGFVPEVMKTLFHETTHLYQFSSTPFGYYFYSLRAFQSNQIVAILRLLQESGLKVKYPLVDFLSTLRPKEKYEQLWSVLYCWYLAEITYLYFAGDREIFFRQQKLNPLLEKQFMFARFLEMEKLIRDYYCATGRRFKYTDHNLSINEANVQQEMATQVLKATGNLDVMSVLESWAKVSEYWESPYGSSVDFNSLFPETMTNESSKYYFLLNLAKSRLKKLNLKEFVLTYSALAELALFSPILPQYAELRKERGLSFNDLHPFNRLFRGINAAAEIEPIRDLENDYPRFIEEVCARTGWPTTMEISQVTQKNFPHLEQELLGENYIKAQQLRNQMPHAFIDMSVWFSPKTDVTAELTYYFTHPVIEFLDKTLLHHDKYIVIYFASQYLLNEYLRKLLLSSDISIPMPFKISKEFTERIHESLSYMITTTTGIKNPKIEFREAGKENAGLLSRLFRS